MRPSIKHHIYRQLFTLSLLTIIALLSLVELMSNDIEDNMVALEIKLEQTYYLPKIGDVARTWQTATTLVAFVPEHTAHFPDLPLVFQGLSVPFSGEIEVLDKEYWVAVSRLPTGILYIARDTFLFDQREEVFFLWIMIVGCLFIVISFVLTQLSARRIVNPLTKLTQELSSIDPRHRTARIDENYRDQELYSIATTFNTYLNSMEEYVKREHMLISMASHELRTPITVVSGALDVLDERGTMGEKDKKTVKRIRDAANEMNANVEAILMLARKQPKTHQSTRIRLSKSIQSVVQKRLSTRPDEQTRLSIVPSEIDHELVGDSALLQMLLRNLIHNALEHTQGNVTLQQNEQGLMILDEGAGLPENVRLQLSRKTALPTTQANKPGLGLFIVTLICEHQGWKIEFNEQTETGTRLQLLFTVKTTPK